MSPSVGSRAMICDRREFLRGGAAALTTALCGCCLTPAADPVLAAMREYVDSGLYGALVCCSNRGVRLAYGRCSAAPGSRFVGFDTRFDLASVGKTQTAALCALLCAEGKVDPDAPFTEYLSEHVLAREKCRITVRDLATHTGGFDNAKPYSVPDAARHLELLFAKRPVRERARKYEYACSNFVYLGMIAEKFYGPDLDRAARTHLWGPLGMGRTTWNTCVGDPDVIVYDRSTYAGPLRRPGEHNDLAAHYAPRPMGNGSCFSTGPEMLLFVTDMLERRTFPQAYYDLQFGVSFDGDGVRRSFGWGMTGRRSWFSDWTATSFSDRAICHTGWTGSGIAVDPAADFAGVVLGSQIAGKAKTMGPRMHLLDLMRNS